MGEVPSEGGGKPWKINPVDSPSSKVVDDWLEKDKKKREREEWAPEELPIDTPPEPKMPAGKPNETIIRPNDGTVDYRV